MKRAKRSPIRLLAIGSAPSWLLLVAGGAGPSALGAEPPPWAGPTYLQVEAGGAFLQDTKFKDLTGATAGQLNGSFDPGARFDVALGYRFTDRWSAEIESGVAWNNMDTLGGAAADLAIYQIPVLLNGKYEFRTTSRFVPYLGLGLGPVINKLDQDVGLRTESAIAVTFGAQAMAGIRYELSERASLGLGYKFLASTEASFKENLQLRAERFLNHAVVVQLNWRY
jgi:opacity protein-like surface antigen